MQINVNLRKVSRYFKSHYFSWSSRTYGSWRFSKLEKPAPIFSKTHSLDITRPYNLLIFEIISKFYKWKTKSTSNKTQQLTPILTEVNIFLNSWTKPSKTLKFNRQPSKLPPHWDLLKQYRPNTDHSLAILNLKALTPNLEWKVRFWI